MKDIGIDPRIASLFYGKFKDLRPAQISAISPIKNGDNLILSAGTGSGKTEAVFVPIISKYWRFSKKHSYLFCIYISPTKALVNDIHKRLSSKLNSIDMRVGVRHGDKDDLKSKTLPHILITTPESLEVLLFRNDESLNNVKVLIIDEVHLLYNTQRGLQLSICLSRLQNLVGENIQKIALSATIGNLENINRYFFGSNKLTKYISFAPYRTIDSYITSVNSIAEFNSLLTKLINRHTIKLLIFTNTRKECEQVVNLVKENVSFPENVFAHYSSLSPTTRFDIEQKFAHLKKAICVATSTLELGIDIGDINVVILWGLTNTVESFLQRIGRGNRKSNKTNVICVIPPDIPQELGPTFKFLTLIDLSMKGFLSQRLPYHLYGAIIQQFFSIVGSRNGAYTKVSEYFQLLSHLTYLNRDTVDNILNSLINNDYLKHHGFKNMFGAGENLYKLIDYRLIYGNFGLSSQTVIIKHGSKILGEVPVINLLRLRINMNVRFSGKTWKVLKISDDYILVAPSSNNSNIYDFIYPGGKISFDSFLVNEMWSNLHLLNLSDFSLNKNLISASEKFLVQFRNKIKINDLPYYLDYSGIRYYTFGGYLVNKAVALFSRQPTYVASDLYLQVPFPIKWNTLPTNLNAFEPYFSELFEVSSEQSIYQSLLPKEYQLVEFIQGWLKDESNGKALNRIVLSNLLQLEDDFLKELL